MYVKLSLSTTTNSGPGSGPGSSYDGGNSTAENPRAALSALLREAADQLDADQYDSIQAAACSIAITP